MPCSLQEYLRLREVHVHAPLNKVLLGSLHSLLICFLAVDPNQLFSKVLWEKFRYLKAIAGGKFKSFKMEAEID